MDWEAVWEVVFEDRRLQFLRELTCETMSRVCGLVAVSELNGAGLREPGALRDQFATIAAAVVVACEAAAASTERSGAGAERSEGGRRAA